MQADICTKVNQINHNDKLMFSLKWLIKVVIPIHKMYFECIEKMQSKHNTP